MPRVALSDYYSTSTVPVHHRNGIATFTFGNNFDVLKKPVNFGRVGRVATSFSATWYRTCFVEATNSECWLCWFLLRGTLKQP